MKTHVVVGGCVLPWRALEGARLSDWLDDQPWHGPIASPCVLHVPCALQDEVLAQIGAEVRRLDERGEVIVDHLGAPDCGKGARQALRNWMQVDAPTDRAVAQALAQLSEHQPRLLVATLPLAAPATIWIADLEIVLQLHAKLPGPGSLATIVMTHGPAPLAGALRLDAAWPAGSHGAQDLRSRWAAYLHERVAWHAGGDLAQVMEAAEHLEPLSVADDQALEAGLDRHAAAATARLDAPTLERLSRDLGPVATDPTLQFTVRSHAIDSRRTCPVPWLARGLLLRTPAHPNRRYLASLAGCRSLAGRLLARAIELEQHARDELMRDPPVCDVAERTMRVVERLKRESQAVEHRLAPTGRSELHDPWDVAPFFELLDARGIKGLRRRQFDELRWVRNALAHGAAVGWKALEIMDSLEGAIRTQSNREHGTYPRSE